MKNIKRSEVREKMQSELDKIYEEEFEEKLKGIAKKLKSKGFPIEAISECTGLSISAVQAI